MIMDPSFKVRLAIGYRKAYLAAVRDYRKQMEHAYAVR
jgi:hypothetical protein